MAKQPRNTTAQQARSLLECRLGIYQQLQLDYLTPLFHKELLYTTKLHQEKLQHPDPAILEQPHQLEHLNSIHAQLEKHWKDLNTNLDQRATLVQLILAYQELLAKSVLLDYRGVPKQVKGYELFVSSTVETLNKHSNAGERSEGDIQFHRELIVTPIEEMMLDQGHVEQRLRLAAEQQRPSSQIYRLINECDWANLATMLIEDRKLLVSIRDQKVPGEDWNMRFICGAGLLAMENTRDRYFTDLTSASTYTISKHARGRSARKAARLPLFPEEAGWHSRLGWAASSAAKSVCDTIIGTLGRLKITKGPGTSARPGFSNLSSPRSSMDEKASTRYFEKGVTSD